MEVKIIKGSTKFPCGCVRTVFNIETETISVTTPRPQMPDDKQQGIDEDDEEWAMLESERKPCEPVQVTETWFYVSSPVNGKFYWVEAGRCIDMNGIDAKLQAKAKLKKLKKKCLKCRKCEIGGQKLEGISTNVFANKLEKAQIMVVGQNPGKQEVYHREPFIGKSGQFFDEEWSKVFAGGRKKLYITNVVKCLTPDNRKPKKDERENCLKFLEREIELVDPVVVITLGNFALKAVTGQSGITKKHGKFMAVKKNDKTRMVYPLLHPSPLNMNKEKNVGTFRKDLKRLERKLAEALDLGELAEGIGEIK